MSKKETEDVQNTLGRLEEEVYLNVEKPSLIIKRQYHKTTIALTNAKNEFDILNDMKKAL